jgi:hypothetical protein
VQFVTHQYRFEIYGSLIAGKQELKGDILAKLIVTETSTNCPAMSQRVHRITATGSCHVADESDPQHHISSE